MKEISRLALQRIQEIGEETEKMATELGSKVLHPNNGTALKFEDVCAIGSKLREIKQWAEAIEENEE